MKLIRIISFFVLGALPIRTLCQSYLITVPTTGDVCKLKLWVNDTIEAKKLTYNYFGFCKNGFVQGGQLKMLKNGETQIVFNGSFENGMFKKGRLDSTMIGGGTIEVENFVNGKIEGYQTIKLYPTIIPGIKVDPYTPIKISGKFSDGEIKDSIFYFTLTNGHEGWVVMGQNGEQKRGRVGIEDYYAGEYWYVGEMKKFRPFGMGIFSYKGKHTEQFVSENEAHNLTKVIVEGQFDTNDECIGDCIVTYESYRYSRGYKENINSYYKGTLKNKKRHGKGRFISGDGVLCEGDWENGLMNGEMIVLFPSGNYIKGGYKKGNLTGYAVCLLDSILVEGKFVNGVPTKKIVLHYPDSTKEEVKTCNWQIVGEKILAKYPKPKPLLEDSYRDNSLDYVMLGFFGAIILSAILDTRSDSEKEWDKKQDLEERELKSLEKQWRTKSQQFETEKNILQDKYGINRREYYEKLDELKNSYGW